MDKFKWKKCKRSGTYYRSTRKYCLEINKTNSNISNLTKNILTTNKQDDDGFRNNNLSLNVHQSTLEKQVSMNNCEENEAHNN